MSRSLSQTAYTSDALSAMTKAQLLAVAEAQGVEGLNGRSRNADIINAILGV